MLSRIFGRISYLAYAGTFLVKARLHKITVPENPHFDDETQKFFIERLSNSKSYLEFGSGGSTLLAGRLGVPTISVESSFEFAAAVQSRLNDQKAVRLLYADIGITRHWGHPVFNNRKPSRVRAWRRYVETGLSAIDNEAFPDFVLVDGRFRVACALAIASQASTVGATTDILVDDYETRSDYLEIQKWIGLPKKIGRSALFTVSSDHPVNIPRTVISAAMLDPN